MRCRINMEFIGKKREKLRKKEKRCIRQRRNLIVVKDNVVAINVGL